MRIRIRCKVTLAQLRLTPGTAILPICPLQVPSHYQHTHSRHHHNTNTLTPGTAIVPSHSLQVPPYYQHTHSRYRHITNSPTPGTTILPTHSLQVPPHYQLTHSRYRHITNTLTPVTAILPTHSLQLPPYYQHTSRKKLKLQWKFASISQQISSLLSLLISLNKNYRNKFKKTIREHY